MRPKVPIPIVFGAITFFSAGLLILVLTCSAILDTCRFLQNSNSTVGMVDDITSYYVEIGTRPNRSRSLSNLALIQFTIDGGDVVRFEHTYGLWEGSLAVGASVPVAYDLNNPEDARVRTFPALWAGYIAMIAASVIFIIAGCSLVLVFKE